MKILVLGGSKGLGLEVLMQLQSLQHQALSFSRKNNFDFSKLEFWNLYLEKLQQEQPEIIIYCAGGGPYGKFSDKEFQAHEWTWKVNFYFPAYLLHHILKNPLNWSKLNKICFVGSAVAESRPDPMAVSYAAAKHALRGLVTSVQAEEVDKLQVQLFSPPYMDTSLLPKNSWPRQQANLVKDPKIVACELIESLKLA